MTTPYDVDQQKLVEAATEELKKTDKIKPPQWAAFVKTGVSRDRAPDQEDWWYRRAASVLRRIYVEGPVGTQRLRNYYGGRKNRGHKPEHFFPGGGSNIRKILQQLENSGYIQKNGNKGRTVSPEGRKMLDSLSHNVKGG